MTANAVQHIPKLESIIMKICEVIFSRQIQGSEDPKGSFYLERIIPTLMRWKETEKECQNLNIFRRKIMRALGDPSGNMTDQEIVFISNFFS